MWKVSIIEGGNGSLGSMGQWINGYKYLLGTVARFCIVKVRVPVLSLEMCIPLIRALRCLWNLDPDTSRYENEAPICCARFPDPTSARGAHSRTSVLRICYLASSSIQPSDESYRPTLILKNLMP